MSKTIGDAFVAVGTKLGEKAFDALTKSEKEIKVFVSTVKKEFSSLQGMFRDYAEEPAKNFGDLIKNFTKWGLEVKKTAKMVNMSTDEISSLFHIAEKKRISVDTLVNGLKNLNRSMIDVRDKTGEAYDAFQQLDIRLKKIDPKTGEEVFKSVTEVLFELDEKLRNTKDSLEKTDLATSIFGKKEGSELKTLFDPAGESLDKLIDKVRTSGVALWDKDTDILSKFNEELSKIDAEFTKFGKTTLIDVISGFNDAINKSLFEPLTNPEEILENLKFFDFLKDEIANFRDVFDFKRGILFLKGGLTSETENIKTFVDDLIEEIRKLSTSSDQELGRISEGAKEIGENLRNAKGEATQLASALGMVPSNGPGLFTSTTPMGIPPEYESEDVLGKDQLGPPSYDEWDEYWAQFDDDVGSSKKELGIWGEAVKGGFEDMLDPMSTFFSAMLSDIDNASAAFKTFCDSIKKKFFDMISKMMAKLAMSGIFKMLGMFIPGAGGFMGLLGGSLELPFFKEGGFASSAKSLPGIPHAQHGLMTKGRGPIPAILHPDEVVLPLGYIREFFGTMSERLFKSMTISPIPTLPHPPYTGAGRHGSVNINLNIGAGNFDDPAYWRNLFRTKIVPAMEDFSYGRL